METEEQQRYKELFEFNLRLLNLITMIELGRFPRKDAAWENESKSV